MSNLNNTVTVCQNTATQKNISTTKRKNDLAVSLDVQIAHKTIGIHITTHN